MKSKSYTTVAADYLFDFIFSIDYTSHNVRFAFPSKVALVPYMCHLKASVPVVKCLTKYKLVLDEEMMKKYHDPIFMIYSTPHTHNPIK